MSISKSQAASLAIMYSSFNQLSFQEARPGRIWLEATDLLEIQKATGVELHDNAWLEEIIVEYRARMKREA